MPKPPRKTVEWSGSTDQAIPWDVFVSLFDALVGSERHNLPRYPAVVGRTTAMWADAAGNQHWLDHLDELRLPYESGLIRGIAINSRSNGEESSLAYAPGAPRPRARASLTADSDKIGDRIATVAKAFPAPFEGAVVFVSWGGDSSREIAKTLHEILRAHLPSADVFFSPVSIDIGEDPMIEMFERHLLQAQALVAVLTTESAMRPWVVWEIATVWARKKLVAALFVDEDIPGPLKLKVQGASIRDRDRVDRAVELLGEAIGASSDTKLSDSEWDSLMGAVNASVDAALSDSTSDPPLPVRISRRTLPLHDGSREGTLLALRLDADQSIERCVVTMTQITGPPGSTAIPTPARLYWNPSREVSEDISQGATDLIDLVRCGVPYPSAMIESPSYESPWSLPDGFWRAELQMTATGYRVQRVTVAFNVFTLSPGVGQSLQWTELTVQENAP